MSIKLYFPHKYSTRVSLFSLCLMLSVQILIWLYSTVYGNKTHEFSFISANSAISAHSYKDDVWQEQIQKTRRLHGLQNTR